MKKARKYFENKNVLITGGSSGIGFSIAQELMQMGASVCLLARNQEKLEEAKHKLQVLAVKPQQTVEILSADVADTERLCEIIPAYLKDNPPVPDVLINAAGVARPGYVEELDLDIFKWTMDIDYHGTVTMTKLLLPYFWNVAVGISSTFHLWQVFWAFLATPLILAPSSLCVVSQTFYALK